MKDMAHAWCRNFASYYHRKCIVQHSKHIRPLIGFPVWCVVWLLQQTPVFFPARIFTSKCAKWWSTRRTSTRKWCRSINRKWWIPRAARPRPSYVIGCCYCCCQCLMRPSRLRRFSAVILAVCLLPQLVVPSLLKSVCVGLFRCRVDFPFLTKIKSLGVLDTWSLRCGMNEKEEWEKLRQKKWKKTKKEMRKRHEEATTSGDFRTKKSTLALSWK